MENNILLINITSKINKKEKNIKSNYSFVFHSYISKNMECSISKSTPIILAPSYIQLPEDVISSQNSLFFVTFIKVSLKMEVNYSILPTKQRKGEIKWAYYFFLCHFLIKIKKYFFISIEEKSFVKFNFTKKLKEINIFRYSTFMHQFILQKQKTSINIEKSLHQILL